MKYLNLLLLMGVALFGSHALAEGGALPHFHERMLAKTTNYKSGGPVLVVAFGDSVTMGALTSGVFAPEDVYHNRLKKKLEQKFPGAAGSTLSIINAGIGGDTAATGLARIDRDVISHHPDLVIVGFGTNDLVGGPAAAPGFEANLRKIIATIREKTQADIILLTPTYMVSRPTGYSADPGKSIMEKLMQAQNSGGVARYAEIIKTVGASENVPVADVYAKWDEMAKTGVDTTAKLVNGLNHPLPELHEIPATLVMDIVNQAFAPGGK